MYLSKHLIHLWVTMRSVCILKTENMQKSTYYCDFLTQVKLEKIYKLLSCHQVRKLNINRLNAAKDYSLGKWLQLTRTVPTYTIAWVSPPLPEEFIRFVKLDKSTLFLWHARVSNRFVPHWHVTFSAWLSHSMQSLPRHTRESPHVNYTWPFLSNFKQFVLFVD